MSDVQGEAMDDRRRVNPFAFGPAVKAAADFKQSMDMIERLLKTEPMDARRMAEEVLGMSKTKRIFGIRRNRLLDLIGELGLEGKDVKSLTLAPDRVTVELMVHDNEGRVLFTEDDVVTAYVDVKYEE